MFKKLLVGLVCLGLEHIEGAGRRPKLVVGYNADGQVSVQYVDPSTAPASTDLAVVTSADGATLGGDEIEFFYDQAWDYDPTAPDFVAEVGATTVRFHDQTGAAAEYYVYRFNSLGALASLTDPDGEQIERDWEGAFASGFTDRSDATWSAERDSHGRVCRVSKPHPTNPSGADVEESILYFGESTVCGTTDDDPRVIETVNAEGEVTTYDYASSGSSDDGTDAVPSSVVTGAGSSAATTTTMESDDGLLTKSTDGDGVSLCIVWDPLGKRRVDSQTTACGTAEAIASSYTYRADGLIDTQTRPSPAGGNVVTTFGYDDARRRTSSVVTSGTTVMSTSEWAYAPDGRLTASNDNGQVTCFGEAITSTGVTRTTTQVNDATGVLADCASPPSGSITTTEHYDRAGRLVDTVTPIEGSTVTTTTYRYGVLGRLENVVADDGGPDESVSWMGYDADGRVTSTTTGPTDADAPHTSTTQYDRWGRAVREIGPSGDTDGDDNDLRSCRETSYDLTSRVVHVAAGAYNSSTGACVAGEVYVGDPASYDAADTYVVPLQQSWMRYDDAGRLRFTIGDLDADGVAPAATIGEVNTDTTALGSTDIDNGDSVVEQRYTPGGRLRRTVTPPADAQTYSWGAANTTARHEVTSYDVAGRVEYRHFPVVGVVTPDTGKATKYTYGDAGQVVNVRGPGLGTGIYGLTSADPFETTTYYDHLGHTSSVETPSPTGTGTVRAVYTYTLQGQVDTVTDSHVFTSMSASASHPSVRDFDYDGLGRLSTVEDANGNATTYGYDLRGLRTSRTVTAINAYDTGDSGRAITQDWDYDRLGRVAFESLPHTGSSGVGTTTTYDEYGRVDTITDAAGRVEERAWANGGWLQSVTWTEGSTTEAASYIVDPLGRRVAATVVDPASGFDEPQVWVYDAGGRMTSMKMANSADNAVAYQWSLTGTPRHITYGPGAGLLYRFQHDVADRLSSSQIAYGSGWMALASYFYDAAGQIRLDARFLNAGSREFYYNQAGKLTSYAQEVGYDANYESSLTYDETGRLATETVLDTPTGDELVKTYGYDPASQLTSAVWERQDTGPTVEQAWAYRYDSRGSRVGLCDGDADPDSGTGWCEEGTLTTTKTTDAAAPLTTCVDGTGTTCTGGTLTTFGYDAAGGRASECVGDTTPQAVSGGDPWCNTGTRKETTTYNPRGDTTAVTTTVSSTTTSQTYRYDADGQLVKTTDQAGNYKEITWDSGTFGIPQIIETNDYTSSNTQNLYTRYSYGYDRYQIAEKTTGPGIAKYYSYDAHGSVQHGGTNAAPAPTDYTPTGQPTDHTGNFWFGYRGELHLTTNTIHLRNRDYDTTTSTFTQTDPLDGINGTPTLANPYHYVDNDPLNGIDPLGLSRLTECSSQDAMVNAYIYGQWGEVSGPTPSCFPTSLERSQSTIECVAGGLANEAWQRSLDTIVPTRMVTRTVDGLRDDWWGGIRGAIPIWGSLQEIDSASSLCGEVIGATHLATDMGAIAVAGASNSGSARSATRAPGVAGEIGPAGNPGSLNTVIGKVDDLRAPGAIQPGERSLLSRLPDQGSPRANYAQNSSVLRQEMSRGVPIRDATIDPLSGQLANNTGFLRAERDILMNHGWSFDPKTGLWNPPSG